MSFKIPSAGPSITHFEIDLVTQAIKDGWGARMNFYIDQFREEFSRYVGVKNVLVTSHCTDAIHLAMLALEIGPGDEVIVPDLTWVASVSPVCYVGAKPVFADVDPISLCITANEIEKKITTKTKAVVVVDLLGNMPEWDPIVELCNKHGIKIIEDAAEGLGAKYKGKNAGQFGHISLFSFNATKLIMAGQGGALCTNDTNLFKKAKLYSHHGIDKELTGKYYWSNVIGYNYNWTNLQAALALAQLRRINELIEYKKWLFSEYQKHLGNNPSITLSSHNPDVDPVYWITIGVVDSNLGIDKEKLGQLVAQDGVDLRPMFYPVSSMPPFKKYVENLSMIDMNPVSYTVGKFGVCFPNGNNLDQPMIKYTCESIKKIIG
jgi:perosamine synthetase